MKYNLFMTSIVVLMLSMVVSKIVYFGFTPNNEANIFSHKAFSAKFDYKGYQYRILSKYMLAGVDHLLGKEMPENGAEPRIKAATSGGSDRFYFSLYYLNTFFLALTSLMVALLLNLDKRLRFSDTEKMLILFLVPVLIGLTEFTVHYYDLSSYFFELSILYLFLKNSDAHYGRMMAAIMVLIVLSTLNRESAEVSVGMIALLLLTRYGATRQVAWSIGGMLACYVVTYIALRYLVVSQPEPRVIVLGGKGGSEYPMDTNMIGLIFWFLFLYLVFSIADSDENRWLIGGFLLFSLPYIISSLASGDLWAVRLYVPLFLGTLFISKLDVAGAAIRISERKWVVKRRLSPAADR